MQPCLIVALKHRVSLYKAFVTSWNTKRLYHSPKGFFIDRVKSSSKINKYATRTLPISNAPFKDLAKTENLAPASLLTSLSFSHISSTYTTNTTFYNTSEHLSSTREETNSSIIGTIHPLIIFWRLAQWRGPCQSSPVLWHHFCPNDYKHLAKVFLAILHASTEIPSAPGIIFFLSALMTSLILSLTIDRWFVRALDISSNTLELLRLAAFSITDVFLLNHACSS